MQLALKKTAIILIMAALLPLCSGVLQADEWKGGNPTGAKKKKGTPVEITADGENRFEAGMAYASGNVVIRHGADVVYADRISYNAKNKEVTAYGNVRVYSKGKAYRSDQVTYNFRTEKIVSSSFLTAQERFLASGEAFTTPGPNHYTVHNGTFTTEDRENPSYRLKANTVEIYPDDRVVLKNMVFHIGDVPILWLPYAAYSLKRDRSMFNISAGSNSRWGAYVLTSYNWQINKEWGGAFNFDYRDRRGFGGGVDLDYFSSKPEFPSKMMFRSFWIHDNGNHIGVGSTDRPVEPPARRFRFTYKHNLRPTDDIYSIFDINVWSDRHVTQDFFPREFDHEREPDNVFNAVYYNPNFTMSVLGRTQINNLFEVAERKPEFKLDFKRQKIPYTFLTYEGEASVVNFERVYDRDDATGRRPYRSVRYDMYHQLLYPRQYFGWLSLTPRVGARGTIYTRNNSLADPTPQKEIGRYVLNTGIEGSFKISKTWLDAQDEEWGIDGIRHVFQPFGNFSYVPPSNEDRANYRGFDDRIANTLTYPLNFPLDKSIDSIDERFLFRHGFRNRIQTKRDGENFNILDWVLYADLDLEREGWGTYTDNAGNEILYTVNHPYPEVYNKIEFNPFPWLRLNIDSAAAVASSGFNEVNASLTWQPHPAIEFTSGYRFLDDVPFIDDSHLITFNTFYRLDESWQLGQYISFEADDGTIQEQRYSIYRDLTSWNLSANAALRDNRDIENEFLLYFALTLKAFPEKSLSINY